MAVYREPSARLRAVQRRTYRVTAGQALFGTSVSTRATLACRYHRARPLTNVHTFFKRQDAADQTRMHCRALVVEGSGIRGGAVTLATCARRLERPACQSVERVTRSRSDNS